MPRSGAVQPRRLRRRGAPADSFYRASQNQGNDSRRLCEPIADGIDRPSPLPTHSPPMPVSDAAGEGRPPAAAAWAALLAAALAVTHLLLPPVPASAQPRTLDALEREIRTVLEPVEGDVAVALRTLGDPGETLLINGRDMFHAASTMKTPVMIELYRQAAAGRFALDDSVAVENRFESIVDGSPYSLDPDDDSYDALYDALGETRTVRALMQAMITASSNLATNLLIEKVGAESVTETMRRYDADRIQVRRGVEDMKAYRRGLNNQTSAHDLMVILERIARKTAVSEAASREMIDILKQQEHNDMIPARLPDSVGVAHKTGWITGLKHDSAIVFVPGGPNYVLVLLSQNLEDTDAAVDAFARVSRLVYDAVTQ
jgi:beta-lactamase class A